MITSHTPELPNSVTHQATPLLKRAAEQASTFAHRGVAVLRDSSQQVLDSAQRTSDKLVKHVKTEPLNSVLIAAATGAALMMLINFVMRSRHD